MITLREFAYYDRRKIEDFISIIEGGLSKESKETKKEIGRELEGGIPNVIKSKASHKEIELQQLKVTTDASLFNKLYDILLEDKLITKVTKLDNSHKLKNGDLIEIKGRIYLSEFEKILMNLEKFIPMMDIFLQQPKSTRDGEQLKKYIKMLSHREISNTRIKPVNNTNDKNIFVAPLTRKNITVGSLIELEEQYFILCRVRDILKKDQKFKLFELMPGINPTEIQMKQALNILEEPSKAFGSSPKIEDFEISYPAVIVTPIAIYR